MVDFHSRSLEGQNCQLLGATQFPGLGTIWRNKIAMIGLNKGIGDE
jgi:hypothetical protein